ncbi:hypothetical protein [Paractinoplanes atraurantiacus]|uniref:Uncharacterized protein n=1 Tax=Paractinoplanes atraurantiacus TaxID=1036182 RepID=A0A285EY75_9ACTN|nr:hypothetical protein [Actinoplanes atraurantiacus]SNY04010.1 hypothetical protein SAMN05421748_101104 [Actinoplanes atraurantiacus]
MSVPNIGPEHFDQGDPDTAEGSRRGNPAPLYRDETVTDDVAAATTRASAVTHRFGGIRYALSRPGTPAADPGTSTEEGGSDRGE